MRFDQPDQTSRREGVWWSPRIIDDVLLERGADLLLYMVIDELEGDRFTLVGYGWPEMTAAGTLAFKTALADLTDTGHDIDPLEPGGGVLIGLLQDKSGLRLGRQLHAFVSSRRRAESGRYKEVRPGVDPVPDRPLRVGDTFAVLLEEPLRVVFDATAGRWHASIDPSKARLFDITFEAREVAQAAFLAAVTPPLPEGLVVIDEQHAQDAADEYEEAVGGDIAKAATADSTVEAADPRDDDQGVSHEATPTV